VKGIGKDTCAVSFVGPPRPSSPFPWREGSIGFEIRLFEAGQFFDVLFNQVDQQGASATIGVQEGTGSSYTQYSYDTRGNVVAGDRLLFAYGNLTFPGTETSATPELGSGELLATGLLPLGLALVLRRRARRTAHGARRGRVTTSLRRNGHDNATPGMEGQVRTYALTCPVTIRGMRPEERRTGYGHGA